MSSNKKKYSLAERKAWGAKMAALRALKSKAQLKKFSGYGAYKSYPKKTSQKKHYFPGLLEGAGSLVGGLGAMALGVPESIGSAIGGGIGKVISNVTGFGDYKVQKNSLMFGGMTPPEIVNSSKEGGFIVRHREYLGDMSACTTFTVNSYPLNPGMAVTFPWLSTIADAFEEYRFRGLIFEFKSLSSDSVLSSSTSSALGSVIMATEYNAAYAQANPFPDKITMENHFYANSSKPSCDFYHPIECKNSLDAQTHLYVRTGAVPSGQDQRLYDLGITQAACVGMQAASGVCGEIWCSYEVEFFKPHYIGGIGAQLLTDKFQMSGTIGNTNPVGTTTVAQAGSNLGCTITTSGTVIQFPANIVDGDYLVHVDWKGSSTACAYPTITYNNCSHSAALGFFGDTSSTMTLSGVTTTILPFDTIVTITGSNANIAFGNNGTLPASITSGDIIVTQINGDIKT